MSYSTHCGVAVGDVDGLSPTSIKDKVGKMIFERLVTADSLNK